MNALAAFFRRHWRMSVRAIGRALDELMAVLAAGFIGFFVMLAYIAGGLILRLRRDVSRPAADPLRSVSFCGIC